MALNSSIIGGRIPFELELKNPGDEKRQFLGFSVSVQRSYKPEGEQYYPEDLIYCKAFGNQAGFINQHFGKGEAIILRGELRRDDDYEKDGETIKGQLYFHVTGVDFPPRGTNNGEKTEKAPAKAAATSSKASAAPTPKANPLTKKPGKKSPF